MFYLSIVVGSVHAGVSRGAVQGYSEGAVGELSVANLLPDSGEPHTSAPALLRLQTHLLILQNR